MSVKNTTPEVFDENNLIEDENVLTQDEILMNEPDLLKGLLDLVNAKDSADNYRKIQIKRRGVLKIEFRIRPISEDESQTCFKRATKYAQGKGYGKPKTAIETDGAKYRAFIVYTATVDEDRKRLWDNKVAWDAAGVLTGVDMIDKVLLPGEKDRIIDLVDEISGYNEALEDLAKN